MRVFALQLDRHECPVCTQLNRMHYVCAGFKRRLLALLTLTSLGVATWSTLYVPAYNTVTPKRVAISHVVHTRAALPGTDPYLLSAASNSPRTHPSVLPAPTARNGAEGRDVSVSSAAGLSMAVTHEAVSVARLDSNSLDKVWPTYCICQYMSKP